MNLAKLGVEAYEIIYNAESLQKAWASEHSLSLSGKELLIEQLKIMKPDVVFFQDSNVFSGEWIDYLRLKIPSIKNIIGWCCNPFTVDQLKRYKNFDYMITCSPLFANQFKECGLRAYVLPHAFEKTILEKIKIEAIEPRTDFLFIGSLISSDDFHNFRTEVIEKLISSDINLKLLSKIAVDNPLLLFLKQSSFLASHVLSKTGFRKFVMNNKHLRKVSLLNEMPKNPNYSDALIKLAEDPIYGLKMFEQIARSKITLNIHGGVAGNYAANMRLFEVTGMGSCLITDWKKNLSELFEIDKEVVSFKSVEECTEKVKWLLEHPSEREAIAKAGQQRVLKDHTFNIRTEQLNEIIQRELKAV